VVIGGLMEDNMANRRASTPWISKIPLLGSLFEHNLEGALKKELVILMRPVSVTEGTWRRAMQESADRIQRMKQQQRLGGRP
jgi:type II secretory pathway component GspD/PulD (secretin)